MWHYRAERVLLGCVAALVALRLASGVKIVSTQEQAPAGPQLFANGKVRGRHRTPARAAPVDRARNAAARL